MMSGTGAHPAAGKGSGLERAKAVYIVVGASIGPIAYLSYSYNRSLFPASPEAFAMIVALSYLMLFASYYWWKMLSTGKRPAWFEKRRHITYMYLCALFLFFANIAVLGWLVSVYPGMPLYTRVLTGAVPSAVIGCMLGDYLYRHFPNPAWMNWPY